MTTLLLLTDVPGLGTQHQLVSVEDHKVIDILAKRQALHATPLVRKRFAKEIAKAYSADDAQWNTPTSITVTDISLSPRSHD